MLILLKNTNFASFNLPTTILPDFAVKMKKKCIRISAEI